MGVILDIENHTGITFSTINGEGTIRLKADNFPTYTVITDFASRGKVEFYGSSYTINTDYSFFNVDVNLDNPANKIIFSSSLTVNGELVVESGKMQIGDNTATVRTIDVNGDLTVQANGKIDVDQTYGGVNVTHRLELAGDFTNEGTCVFSDAGAYDPTGALVDVQVDVRFNNPIADQKVYLDGPTQFYRIVSDKGVDANYLLDIEATAPANFELIGKNNIGGGGATAENGNALGLKSGTVKLSNNIVIPALFSGGGNYDLPESAALWIHNSEVTVPSAATTALVVYGKILVTGPLAIFKVHMRSGVTLRGTSVFEVQDGVVELNQFRTSSTGGTHKGAYIQSGGYVTVDNNFGGNASGQYFIFDLAETENTFKMSGGTLHVVYERHEGGANNRGAIFINSDVTNQDVTGGNVIVEVANTTPAGAVCRISSKAPFYNLTLRNSDDGSQDITIEGASSGNPVRTITNQPLIVKGDLLVESNATLAHQGNAIKVYGNFEIQNSGDMPNGCNLYMLGDGNTNLIFDNKTGSAVGNEQRLNYFIIDKGVMDTLFISGGKNINSNNGNNLIRVTGPAFKLLSGTVDHTNFSIRMYCDTVLNYGTFGLYNGLVPHASVGSRNDMIKFRDSNAPFVLLTNDNSKFGRVRWNNANNIVDMVSNVAIQSFQYKHGRLNLNRHNLKIDELELALAGGQANYQGCAGGCNSVQDMFITDGNESDGGLSLLIPTDGVNAINASSQFVFPIGVGIDNGDIDVGDGTSRYTPVTVTMSDMTGVTESAYITVRPVNSRLNTTNLTPNSDYLNYYWGVTNSYTAGLPKINLQANYYDSDVTDDGDGATTDETDFVPGKVLDVDPYTRSSELPANINTATNTLIFDAGSNFTLENANYTAGVVDRFTGTPDIFYSREISGQRNWHDGNRWRKGDPTTGTLGQVPTTGSIAIIRDRCRMNVRVASVPSPAKVVLDHDFVNYPIPHSENIPRLQFHVNGTYDMGKVTGTGMVSFNGPRTINLSGDFGDIGTDSNSVYLYFGGGATISSPPNPIPSLMVEGGTKTFSNSLAINYDLIIQGNTTMIPQRDMVMKRDMLLGFWIGGTLLFPNQATPITVTVGRNIDFTTYTNSHTRRMIPQGGVIDVEHKLIVKGDITQGTLNSSRIDLWESNTRTRVVLELQGETNNTYTRGGTNVPQLYRVVMNKGTDKTKSFTFSDDFTLHGVSNTAIKPVEIRHGRLVFDDVDIDIDLSTGGADFLIPNGSALEVKQGEVNVVSSNVSLDGCLIVSGGTVDMSSDGNTNNLIYTSSGGAELLVSGGNLHVGGQMMRELLDAISVLRYTQSSGIARFGINGASHPQRGVFELIGAGSEYTRSGGSLSIESGNGSVINAAFAIVNPSVFSESGASTVLIGGGSNGATTIGINSTEELNTLEISGAGDNPIGSLLINPLQIKNLIIGSGSKLKGNDLDIYVSDTWDNNAGLTGFEAGVGKTGTTFCRGTRVDVTGNTRFNHLTNNCTSRTVLGVSSETYANNVRNASNFYTEDNDFHVAGNMMNNKRFYSSAGAVVFDGTETQYIQSETGGASTNTRFDKIRVNNTSNVELLEYSGKRLLSFFYKDIELENGSLSIGDNYMFIYSATTVTGVGFDKTKMIRTNGRTSSYGVRLVLYAGQSYNQYLPIGVTGKISPIDLNLTNSGAGRMDVIIRAVNEQHPTTLAAAYSQNLLDFYWRILYSSPGSQLDGTLKMYYDQNDVNGDEGIYGSAKFVGGSWVLKVPDGILGPISADVDTLINEITFDVTNITTSILIDYTCGDTKTPVPNNAFPINVPIYVSQNTGIWNLSTNWLKDGVINEIPQIGSKVIVQNGHTITFDANSINVYQTEISGKVKVNSTIKHNLGIVTGTGVIDMNTGLLPGGSYDDFLTTTGGGIEYSGTGTYTGSARVSEIRSLTFSGTGTRVLPAISTTVGDSIVIDGVTVDNTINNTSFDLQGDIALRNGGKFHSGTGGINFTGTKDSHIKTSMEGENQIYNMTLGKTVGDVYIDNGTVEVKKEIDFQKGRIIPGNNVFLMDKDIGFITQPWDSSHVQGNACKTMVTGGTFTFPIGDDYQYSYARVNSPTAGLWCSRFYDKDPLLDGYPTANIKTETPQVTSITDLGYWDIEGPVGGKANGGIALNWAWSTAHANPGDAEVVEWDAVNSYWYGRGGVYNLGINEAVSDSVIHFSKKQFTIGSITAGVLPIELLEFKVSLIEGNIALRWITAQEHNNYGFEIERSYDLTFFENIGFVNGKGTSTIQSNYSFLDDDAENGVIYYRLKSIDYQGDFTYSKVISVNVLSKKKEEDYKMIIYPNPSFTGDEITFEFTNHSEKVRLTIYDLEGEILLEEDDLGLDEDGIVRKTMHLKPGIYLIETVSNVDIYHVKLVVE